MDREFNDRLNELHEVMTDFIRDYAPQAPTAITGVLTDNDFFFSGLQPLPVNRGFLCMSYNRLRAQMRHVPLPVRFEAILTETFSYTSDLIAALSHAISTTTESMGMPIALVAKGQLELNAVVSEYIFLQGNMTAAQVRNTLLALILYVTNDGVRTVRQLACKSFVSMMFLKSSP
ncbi:uncharacterized protein EV154DRAFT_548594 [Mucor mucedo]|uniref:uncharacterized protein n=1 Tax=Mucor mucedo TaxID=29922 RepID=UPI00221E5E6D|nr:uncharacterized protein EV154DRAFT_548594 [Mucor mucedo]KAI7895016.1 hypothetical protein EV154DRAFT_548594 [Mucor mucedo]